MIRLITALLLTVSTHALAQSAYDNVLQSAAGRDSLRDLALWEDQRVTGDGQLFAYLGSSNPLIRLRAVEAIGRIQDPIDAAHLLPMLSDPNPRVVEETIFALGQMETVEATAALVEFMPRGTARQVALCAGALGKIADEAAVEALSGLLRDFRSDVRGEAAIGLARAADNTALNALLLAIHDPDPDVVWMAVHALEKFKSGRAAKQVTALLDHDDPRVRAVAARTVGKQKHGGATKGLIALLADAHMEVVINAAIALGEIESKDAIHPLGEVLTEHETHQVRRIAAQVLGVIGDKKGKDYLIQALMQPSPGVRAESILALAKILDDEAGIFTDQLANDGSRYVRAAAIECMGMVGSKRHVARLQQIAVEHNDAMMQAAAIRGLGHVDDDREAIGAFLVTRLDDDDWVVASEVAGALGALEREEAVPAMIAQFRERRGRQDGNVKMEILRAFEEMQPDQAVELLRECADDPDARIRSLAASILETMEVDGPAARSDREFYEAAFDRSRRRDLAMPAGLKRAVIHTPRGDIELELFGDSAVQTVESFTTLVKKGFYNGLVFHRVAPNFVIQGGDPRGDSWGDAGYYIRSEFNQYRYDRGYVGVAHDGKDTGGSQFFITHSPAHRLDGRYTIFGRVTKGMDVVWQIDQGDEMRIEMKD